MHNIVMLNPPFITLKGKGRFSREQRSPGVTKSGTLYYPMWLAYAAGALQAGGYKVKLIDAPARGLPWEDTAALVQESRPAMIVLDTSTPSIHSDIRAATELKARHPQALIVMVGPHVSATAEETLDSSPHTDVVARGEYESILLDLAGTLAAGGANLASLPGISYRAQGRIIHNPGRDLPDNLDDLPWVSRVYREHLHYRDYFYAHSLYPVVSIVGGRGCPFKCYYCVYPQVFSGAKVRYRSVSDIVDEMEFITRAFPGVKEIMFEDDTLTLNAERCQALCREIMARKLKIAWSCNSRADAGYDTLALMRQAGCRLVCVGFESGDQRVLDNINKGISLETMKRFARDAAKAGLLMHGCFMAGNTGDTPATLQATLDFARTLNPDTAQFFPLMPYPGTRAYEWSQATGALQTRDYRNWVTPEGWHNCVLKVGELSPSDLVAFCALARKRFYLRWAYLAKKLLQLAAHPGEVLRTLKAFKNFFRHLVSKA